MPGHLHFPYTPLRQRTLASPILHLVMRRLLFACALVALAVPASAYAVQRAADDGTLEVKNAVGTIQIAARGAVLGRCDKCTLWITDPDPSDTFTYWADWDNTGEFDEVTADAYTTNPDGSVSFNHAYDDNGTYTPVIRVMDAEDDYTDYSQTVLVTNVAPTAAFTNSGPINEGSSATVSSTTCTATPTTCSSAAISAPPRSVRTGSPTP